MCAWTCSSPVFRRRRQNILHFYHTLLGLGICVVVAWGGYLMVQKAYASLASPPRAT